MTHWSEWPHHDTSFIPLASAYLCCNCECIVADSRTCPKCQGTHLIALAAILNRKEKPA